MWSVQCERKALTAKKQLRARARKPAFDHPLAGGLGATEWTKPVEPRCGKTDQKRLQATAGRPQHCCSERTECNEPKAGCHELLIWIFWGRTGALGCAARYPVPNGPRRLCANSSEIHPEEWLGAPGGWNGAPAG